MKTNSKKSNNGKQIVFGMRGIFTSMVLVGIFAFMGTGYAMNIDATNKYAWGENIGWINFGTTEGDVDVTATAIDGYAWGENIGWISLTCSNTASCGTVDYGATISGSAVAGYAWGENVGWISFNCSNTASCATVDYGVTFDPATGIFSGYAWGENVGWVVFNCSTTSSCATVDYKLQSAALSTPTPTPAPGGGGSTPTPTPTPLPTASPSALPTVTPTPTISPSPVVSPVFSPTDTPAPTGMPAPTASPTGAPSSPPTPGGGASGPGTGPGGTVVQVVSAASRFFDEVVAKFFDQLTDPETAAGAAVAATIASVLPVIATAAGAVAQKEVAASVFQLLQIVGLRRRPKVWGVIYDSNTKRPIPLAKIELVDSTGRVLETRYADRDGRYGFLTSPSSMHAHELRVRIRAQKSGYAFPTVRSAAGTDFVVYRNAYRGDEVVLHGDALVKYDIPVDPLVRGHASLGWSVWHLFRTLIDKLLLLGFYIGLVVVPLNLWLLPNTTNIVIFTIFFLVNGIQMFVMHRPYGVTLDALTGKRLPYALVTLNDLQGNRVGFAVSDEQGRFILSGEQNKDYELVAFTPANISPQRTVRVGIRGLKRLSTRAWITTNIRI